eukprot:Hpha_TRINITY_DN17709_c0_g1::TRINITY_DN17709_c0_g1_i1::g.46271::m.46271
MAPRIVTGSTENQGTPAPPGTVKLLQEQCEKLREPSPRRTAGLRSRSPGCSNARLRSLSAPPAQTSEENGGLGTVPPPGLGGYKPASPRPVSSRHRILPSPAPSVRAALSRCESRSAAGRRSPSIGRRSPSVGRRSPGRTARSFVRSSTCQSHTYNTSPGRKRGGSRPPSPGQRKSQRELVESGLLAPKSENGAGIALPGQMPRVCPAGNSRDTWMELCFVDGAAPRISGKGIAARLPRHHGRPKQRIPTESGMAWLEPSAAVTRSDTPTATKTEKSVTGTIRSDSYTPGGHCLAIRYDRSQSARGRSGGSNGPPATIDRGGSPPPRRLSPTAAALTGPRYE